MSGQSGTPVVHTYDVFFSRGGYAQVRAASADEARRIADTTLTEKDIAWDDDWPATDALLEGEECDDP